LGLGFFRELSFFHKRIKSPRNARTRGQSLLRWVNEFQLLGEASLIPARLCSLQPTLPPSPFPDTTFVRRLHRRPPTFCAARQAGACSAPDAADVIPLLAFPLSAIEGGYFDQLRFVGVSPLGATARPSFGCPQEPCCRDPDFCYLEPPSRPQNKSPSEANFWSSYAFSILLPPDFVFLEILIFA